jgi:hypothetical protein
MSKRDLPDGLRRTAPMFQRIAARRFGIDEGPCRMENYKCEDRAGRSGWLGVIHYPKRSISNWLGEFHCSLRHIPSVAIFDTLFLVGPTIDHWLPAVGLLRRGPRSRGDGYRLDNSNTDIFRQPDSREWLSSP